MITLRYSQNSDKSVEDSKFRRASCNLVSSSSSQAAISSCLCFFNSLGHSSGKIVSSRVVFWTCAGRPFSHFICILLEVESSMVGNEVVQAIHVRILLACLCLTFETLCSVIFADSALPSLVQDAEQSWPIYELYGVSDPAR